MESAEKQRQLDEKAFLSFTDKPALKSIERLMSDGVFKVVKVVSDVDGHELTQLKTLMRLTWKNDVDQRPSP